MEPFIELLQQLHRGIPMEFWPEMLRDIRVYARVGSDGLGFALWPKCPITIEGTVFDQEHPILVREYGRGTLRLIDHQWEQGTAPLRDAS